jgi:hypothetical protein
MVSDIDSLTPDDEAGNGMVATTILDSPRAA